VVVVLLLLLALGPVHLEIVDETSEEDVAGVLLGHGQRVDAVQLERELDGHEEHDGDGEQAVAEPRRQRLAEHEQRHGQARLLRRPGRQTDRQTAP